MKHFWKGFFSAFDISGTFWNRDINKIISKTPEEAIAEDWQAIGDDMRKVMDDMDNTINKNK